MGTEWSRRLAGYTLAPTVPARQVAEFEERNRIVLPAEYRTFITTICSGIHGDPNDRGRLTELLSSPSFDQDDDRLRHPFPLVEYRPFDDDVAFEQARGGQLYLATDGCTCDWYLIVTGSERGGMWEIEAEGAQPCAPKLTFLPWLKLRIDCDSGRNSMDWWDVVWRDVQPAVIEKAEVERHRHNENMLRDALLAELARKFPGDMFHLGEDARTIVTFPAAHPEVGDVTICNEGDGAVVFIGDITREHFRSHDAIFDSEGAERVARRVSELVADLLADKIILWRTMTGSSSGHYMPKSAFRKEDMEEWSRYYLWSGPIQKKRWPTRGWRLW